MPLPKYGNNFSFENSLVLMLDMTPVCFPRLHSALTGDQMFRCVMETVGRDFPVSSFSIG